MTATHGYLKMAHCLFVKLTDKLKALMRFIDPNLDNNATSESQFRFRANDIHDPQLLGSLTTT